MAKTNVGLTLHAEKALKEKWYYLWGSYGQIPTVDLIDRNIRQYPTNSRWRSYAMGAIGKTRVCDCYGIVKSYLWWQDDTKNPIYNPKHDRNTQMAFNSATVKGPLSTIPEIVGLVLWMPGHVGVYLGNNRFMECAGGGAGCIEGKITNGKITKGSKFTHWFKDTFITYLDDQLPEYKPPVVETPKEEPKEEEEMIYKKYSELPAYAVPTIKKLYSKGTLSGNGVDEINIYESNIQLFMAMDNLGLLDHYDKVTEVPSYATNIIQTLMNEKILNGDEQGNLNLSLQMIRLLKMTEQMINTDSK